MKVHLEQGRTYRGDVHLSWAEEFVEKDADLEKYFTDLGFEHVKSTKADGEHWVVGVWPKESTDFEFNDAHLRDVQRIA